VLSTLTTTFAVEQTGTGRWGSGAQSPGSHPQSESSPAALSSKDPAGHSRTNRRTEPSLLSPARTRPPTEDRGAHIDPKSDSLVVLDDRVAAGDHTIPIPDHIPPKRAFATVQVDAAIYNFSIATEQ
jgi:hypothetical protein